MDFLLIMVMSFVFALTLFSAINTLTRRKISKLPPGPAPLPLIGNLHLLVGAQPHECLAKLAATYGPIMSLKLGQVTSVVISSPAMAKEVLQRQDLAFSSRFVLDAATALDYHNHSVAWLQVGSRWRSLRKIMNANMFSCSSLDASQDQRSRKVEELMEYCRRKSKTGEALKIGEATFGTVLSILSNTIFSKDLTDPYSDSAKEFKELLRSMVAELGRPNLVDYFPVLRKFDPQGIRRRETSHITKVFQLFDDLIKERLEQRSKGITKNDVLDVFLKIREENSEGFVRQQTHAVCLDLYAAGTDTTTSSVEWAMAELLKNPKALIKAKKELAHVVGSGKPIKEVDLPKLPYLQCVVKETLRVHPPVPFLVPRRVEKDVQVCEYIVPKGSQVLVNAWMIGRDPSLWENPLSFVPDRFWQSEVDIQGQNFELIPFGAGRRTCPGLSLALRILPLILGSLLNCFDWKLEGDISPDQLNMKETIDITLQKAYPLRVIPVSL